MGKNVFTVTPQWLRALLGLTEPGIPNKLDDDSVIAVAEIVQGGWSQFAQTQHVGHAVVTVAAGTAAGVSGTVATSGAGDMTLCWLSIEHAGGAGAMTVEVVLNLSGFELVLATASIAVGAKTGHCQLAGSIHPFLVPANWTLLVRHPGTAAGESLTIRRWRASCRMGSKVL